jgi:hypothetical protein
MAVVVDSWASRKVIAGLQRAILNRNLQLKHVGVVGSWSRWFVESWVYLLESLVRGVLGVPVGVAVGRHPEHGLLGRYVHRRRRFLVSPPSVWFGSGSALPLSHRPLGVYGHLRVGVGLLKFLSSAVTRPRSLVPRLPSILGGWRFKACPCQLAIAGCVVTV